jgi:hypothetical protein
MLLAQAAIYLLALGGIVLCSILALRFAGPALNPTRTRAQRIGYALAALASLAGVVASAAAGFLGIAALLYIAQR